MAATDAPATLSELQTAFLDAMKEVTGNSAVNTIVTRYLNLGLQDMHQEKWAWAERRSVLRTRPPYATGTVDVAITDLTARRAVTGTGTAWNTANSFGEVNGIGAGAKMMLGSSLVVHQVSAIGSDTALTLDASTPFAGASALDDAPYRIYQDEYALAADFGDPVDVRYFDADRTIHLIGGQEFYRLYARNDRSGAPQCATLVEIGPSGSAALRPRVVFGPSPDQTYLIPYRYMTRNLAVSSAGVGAANLTAATDEPIVPMAFRMGIVYKALELWFASRQRNPQLSTDFAGRYATLMLRARQRFTPADDRPRLMPQVAHYRNAARKPWRAAGGHYDGGVEWDRLDY
jgi:hypothetical protein